MQADESTTAAAGAPAGTPDTAVTERAGSAPAGDGPDGGAARAPAGGGPDGEAVPAAAADRPGDAAAETFTALRPYLFSIAYRMLGSVADAEDVVQEAFLRWRRVEPADVTSPKAYLSSVVTRLAIDHLRSARVARETYVGPWLPEPIVTAEDTAATRAELADSLSMAFLVLLESLSPVERAVFLLRETFGYDYAEIAAMVGRSEDNCRQIALRARKHIEARRPRFEVSRQGRDEMTARFLEACSSGDLSRLVGLLTDDIVLWSDGGGKVQAARRPIAGAEAVARFVLGLVRKWGDRLTARAAEVNGQAGFVLVEGDRTIGVLLLDIVPDPAEPGDPEAGAGALRIAGIRIVVNPEKLGGVL